MLELLAGERMLGCATGYYTAVLPRLWVHGRVIAIQIDPELSRRARANLAVVPTDGSGGTGVDFDRAPVSAADRRVGRMAPVSKLM
jgi:protein-L-isoaspartate O-methyltransferase